MNRFATRMAAAIFCVGAPHFAHAADTLYAYESFDYFIGSSLAGQSGGSGWAGTWASNAGTNSAAIVAGLEYTDAAGQVLVTSGGATRTSSSVFFAQETRNTTKQFGEAGTSVWVSFLIQQVPNPSAGTSYGVLALGQGLTFGSNAMYGGVVATNSRVGTFYSATEFQNSAVTVAADSVSFITLRYDFASSGNDTINLWINPLLSAPLDAPDVSGSFRNYSSAFTGVTLAYGDNKSFVYDEVRVGSTYSAVTAVPEPQTLILLLAGLAVIATRGQRSV
jgi:hypothetical protein